MQPKKNLFRSFPSAVILLYRSAEGNLSDHFFIDLAEMREIIIADLCGNQADRKY